MCRQRKSCCVLAAAPILLAGSLPPLAQAGGDAKADPKPLPQGVVKAWTDAGAVVGWIHVNHEFGVLQFSVGKSPPDGAVPAFRFAAWAENMLAKLPVPGALFGLDLSGTQVADAGLKELVRL